MKIAVIGSRAYPDLGAVTAYVRSLPADTVILSGGAPGVDTSAASAAHQSKLRYTIFRADWATYGRAAGPIRNEQLVSEADRVVAFWDGQSPGTRNALSIAERLGKPRLTYRLGNILDDDAQARVVTVNTVGVMGKGLAKQTAERYPKLVPLYQEACRDGRLTKGGDLCLIAGRHEKVIIFFATKEHWKHQSKLEWITNGLQNLSVIAEFAQFSSIALPPLGCGLGGLDWRQVEPLIRSFAQSLPDVRIYPPPRGR